MTKRFRRLCRRTIIFAALLAASASATAAGDVAGGSRGGNDDAADEATQWSTCNGPAAEEDGERRRRRDRPPSARVAYLISVHNRRTIADGAHLLRALVETSHPGDIAAIVVHVDRRVGIDVGNGDDGGGSGSGSGATEEDGGGQQGDGKDRFLYRDSPLRRYVDACVASPACTRQRGRGDKNDNYNDNDNGGVDEESKMILEVHSHFSPEWSKWSMNDPTLWAMDYLLHHPALVGDDGGGGRRRGDGDRPSWDVFVNLSGDTMPVISASRISQLFEPTSGPLGGTNFVTSSSCATGLLPTSIYDFPKHSMKRSHYFQHNVPKKLTYVDVISGELREDVETPIHFGSQWMALTRPFVEHAMGSMDHPNGIGSALKRALVDSSVLMTDETFLATLLMNSPEFADTLPELDGDGRLASFPSMRSLRYERMDENAPNAWGEITSTDPLYDVPAGFGDATGGEGPARPWGPYFLGVYDLGAIRDSGALFVRKVSGTVDGNLVRMLPVRDVHPGKTEWDALPDVRWPELGVKIRDPFVWELREEEKDEDGE